MKSRHQGEMWNSIKRYQGQEEEKLYTSWNFSARALFLGPPLLLSGVLEIVVVVFDTMVHNILAVCQSLDKLFCKWLVEVWLNGTVQAQPNLFCWSILAMKSLFVSRSLKMVESQRELQSWQFVRKLSNGGNPMWGAERSQRRLDVDNSSWSKSNIFLID